MRNVCFSFSTADFCSFPLVSSVCRLLFCQLLYRFHQCLPRRQLICGSSVLSSAHSLLCFCSSLVCTGDGKSVDPRVNSIWRRFKWLKRAKQLLRYVTFVVINHLFSVEFYKEPYTQLQKWFWGSRPLPFSTRG